MTLLNKETMNRSEESFSDLAGVLLKAEYISVRDETFAQSYALSREFVESLVALSDRGVDEGGVELMTPIIAEQSRLYIPDLHLDAFHRGNQYSVALQYGNAASSIYTHDYPVGYRVVGSVHNHPIREAEVIETSKRTIFSRKDLAFVLSQAIHEMTLNKKLYNCLWVVDNGMIGVMIVTKETLELLDKLRKNEIKLRLPSGVGMNFSDFMKGLRADARTEEVGPNDLKKWNIVLYTGNIDSCQLQRFNE